MSKMTRVDVTAVKLYKNYVLAGIGSSLHVFDKDSVKLIQKIPVLIGQKIYGIVISDHDCKLMLFGGKQFTTLTISEEQGEVFSRSSEVVICDDWLHSGIWKGAESVSLLTAHNVVQIWDTSKQELEWQYVNKHNSILYSGLLLALEDGILVFSGTVFSDILLQICGDEEPIHWLKGHKGVIFSILCDPLKRIIVTTSDDRSVRIWSINTLMVDEINTKYFWRHATIHCAHELYGHSARVMRSCLNDHIISVGEDSGVCFWDHNGKLVKKIVSHQNSCIWSLDADDKHLVTGGGDCGITLHPFTLTSDCRNSEILDINIDAPKKIAFTARKNIVILNENDELMYYDVDTKHIYKHKLNHESTYKLLSISPCKQIVAVAEMCGQLDVFIENCKGAPSLQNIVHTKLNKGKVLSMQWASSRHLVLCSENGIINVLASKSSEIEVVSTFILKHCKERWLTSAAIDSSHAVLVVGDRCGNIHVYTKDKMEPLKSFNRVHGRYGPTSITIKNNEIITTGRDGSIKYFSLVNDCGVGVHYLRSVEIEFPWVEKFVDKNEKYICGFQERIFVVRNAKNVILEVPCGGGHRSWDVVCYIDNIDSKYEEIIRLMYVKNSNIHLDTFQLSKMIPKIILNGTHSKEINCLKTYCNVLDPTKVFYITGGEDTSLRISSVIDDYRFEEEFVFKHLSNIRTLKIYPLEDNDNNVLLISAGGRAQISIKLLKFSRIHHKLNLTIQELKEHQIKGTDKERKGNQNWRNCSIDFDPETRIMDLDVMKIGNDYLIFTGCSDTSIRIFRLNISYEVTFNLIQDIKFHNTCILKVNLLQYLNKSILATCTTRGEVAFWDVTNIDEKAKDVTPFFGITTHKSGINSFAWTQISHKTLLIATGGDDNAINLNLLKVQNDFKSMKLLDHWSGDFHCSQVSGLVFIDDLLISTSIDQRVTLFRWRIEEDGIKCEFASQTFSDVADIQGMDMVSASSTSITVCVFGKGIEVIEVPRPDVK